jgi:hypothetical protein
MSSVPLYAVMDWLYACFVSPGYLVQSIINGATNVALNYAVVAAFFGSALLIELAVTGWRRLSSALRARLGARS